MMNIEGRAVFITGAVSVTGIDEIGEMVLKAVLENVLYIFTDRIVTMKT